MLFRQRRGNVVNLKNKYEIFALTLAQQGGRKTRKRWIKYFEEEKARGGLDEIGRAFLEIVETKEWKAWKKGVPYTPQRRQTTQEEFKL